jgi:opacity protein-like surface antigen
MKKLYVSAALFLFGALAVQAEPRTGSPKPKINRNPAAGVMAQHQGSFAFVPKLGFVVPTGDYGDLSNNGIRFQGAAEYYIRNDWALGVSTAFAQTNVNDDTKNAQQAAISATVGGPVTITSWKFRTLQYGAYARHLFATSSPKIAPYVNGGLAIYSVKSTVAGSGATQAQLDASTGAGQRDNNFGFNLGGGVSMNMTPNVGFMVGMTYHNAFSDPSTNYFVFNGGLNFFFNPGR